MVWSDDLDKGVWMGDFMNLVLDYLALLDEE